MTNAEKKFVHRLVRTIRARNIAFVKKFNALRRFNHRHGCDEVTRYFLETVGKDYRVCIVDRMEKIMCGRDWQFKSITHLKKVARKSY